MVLTTLVLNPAIDRAFLESFWKVALNTNNDILRSIREHNLDPRLNLPGLVKHLLKQHSMLCSALILALSLAFRLLNGRLTLVSSHTIPNIDASILSTLQFVGEAFQTVLWILSVDVHGN